MTKGGILIRLIDVAMIILFGFIAISDIKVRAQIKLPSDKQDETVEEKKKEPALIFVKIDPENRMNVEQDETLLFTAGKISQLETYLTGLVDSFKTQHRDMVVLVEPDENSVIQQTIDVLDVCERHGIPKNINYESMQF